MCRGTSLDWVVSACVSVCVPPVAAAAALLLSSGVEAHHDTSAAEVCEIPAQVGVQALQRKQEVARVRHRPT